MFRQVLWSFVALVYFTNSCVFADIDPEDKDAMMIVMKTYVDECIDEFGYSEKEIKSFKDEGKYEDIDPCFISCFFKKGGLINDQGMYDVDKAKEFDETYLKDEEDLKSLEKVRNDCAKVNDKTVDDGSKGCERAALLAECYFEHKEDVVAVFLKCGKKPRRGPYKGAPPRRRTARGI